MATGVSIPLRGLEGIPGLPGASQDEAVRTRKFEMSHGGVLYMGFLFHRLDYVAFNSLH